MNRAGRPFAATSTSGPTAATLSRPTRIVADPIMPDHEPSNTSTLPYIRNFYKTNTNSNSNLPKSVSTWGPLHKPLHWKVRSC